MCPFILRLVAPGAERDVPDTATSRPGLFTYCLPSWLTYPGTSEDRQRLTGEVVLGLLSAESVKHRSEDMLRSRQSTCHISSSSPRQLSLPLPLAATAMRRGPGFEVRQYNASQGLRSMGLIRRKGYRGKGACGCLCVRVVCLFFYLREDHLITSTRVIEVHISEMNG